MQSRLSSRSRQLALTGPIAALLALSSGPRASAVNGSWSQVTAGNQLWSLGSNWTGGIIADGVDAVATFNTNLTADQNISVEAGGRTIGHLFFQDPTTSSAGGFGLGVAGDGPVTLDVTSGPSVISVGALGSSKKIATGAPIVNNDGILKIGVGELSIRADNPGMTGSFVAAGGFVNTRSLMGISSLQVVNGSTFQVDFFNNGGTNVTELVNSAATVGLGGSVLIPTTAIPAPLPLSFTNPVATNAILTITGKAGSTNVQSFAGVAINSGSHTINVVNGGAGSAATLNLGALTHGAGGQVNFAPSGAGTSSITTTTANTGGIVGGWATVGGTTWAVSAGNGVTAGALTGLADAAFTADTWAPGVQTDVVVGIPAASGATESIRFNTAAATTVALTGAGTINSGGILVTSVVAANASQINGSTLTSGTNELDITNNSTGTLTVSSAIVNNTGPLSIAKTGAGAVTLSGANTFTGGIFVSGGTLTLSGPNSGPGAMLIQSGATLQIGTGGTTGTATSGAISNFGTFAVNRSDAITIASVISGTGGLNKNGAGTLTLTGNNSYSGVTNDSGGTIAVTTDTALGTGNFRFNAAGAALRSADMNTRTIANFLDIAFNSVFGSADSGNLVFTGTLATGNGAKTMTINNAITTFSGVMTGGPSVNYITKAGTGTMILSNAASTAKRPITIDAGTLQISSEVNLGANPDAATATNPAHLAFNGGTLQTTATFAIDDSNRGVTLNANGGTFNVDPSTTLTITNVIAGAGALTKAGTGTLTLNGANTYTGATLVTNGTLVLGVSGSLAGSTSIEVRSGGTLDVSTSSLALGGTQTLLGNGAVTGSVNAAAGATVAPGLTGAVGTLAIGGSLTLNGSTISSQIGTNTTPGGIFNDLITVAGNLILNGLNTIQIQFAPPVAGNYRLIDYSGTLTGSAANLTVPNQSRLTLTPNTTTPGQINLNVSGSLGNLIWSGGTTNEWDVQTSSNWNAGTEKYFQYDAVTFNDTSVNTVVNLNTTVTPSNVVVNTDSSYIFTGTGKISGATALTKSGSGTLVLATPNDFAGPVNVTGGSLVVGFGGSLGTGAVDVDAPGSLTYEAGGTVAANIVNDGSVNLNSAMVLSGVVSGTGTLNINATGAQLTGTAANTLTGATTIASGALQLNKTAGVNAIAGDLIVNGGTVTWAQPDQIANGASITVNAGSFTTGNRAETVQNLTINSGVLSTFSGMTINGTLTITTGVQDAVNSAGTLLTNTAVLSGGSNSRLGANSGNSIWTIGSGGLSMDFATIQLGQVGGAFTAQVNLGGNFTGSGTNAFTVPNTAGPRLLDLQNAVRTFNVTNGTTTIAPAVQNGGIAKSGDGALVLDGLVNSYTGATTVNAGSLIVNGSISGSATTVKTGASVGGTGTLGTTNIEAGGSIAPGITNGILKTGNLSLAGTYILELGGLGFSDQLIVTGGITLGGTLNGSLINGYTPIADDLLFILINDNADPISGTFSGLAQGSTLNIGGYDFRISYTANSDTNAFAGAGNDVALLAVPEPGSAVSLLAGLSVILGWRRRRS